MPYAVVPYLSIQTTDICAISIHVLHPGVTSFLVSLLDHENLQQILVATDSVLEETGNVECKHGAYTCDGKVLEELARAPCSLQVFATAQQYRGINDELFFVE